MLEINISVFMNNNKVRWSLHLHDQQSTLVILETRLCSPIGLNVGMFFKNVIVFSLWFSCNIYLLAQFIKECLGAINSRFCGK